MTGLRAALVAAWCRCAAPYEALFVNGATRPPRTMVVSVEGRGNATLAAGEGAAFDAAPGVAVDWFEHPASAASFADRVVVASRRYVEPFDRDDRAAARQFVFLDALHVAPCRDGVPATAPLERATYADANRSFRVDVLARRPLVAAVAGFAAPGECDALRAAADAEGRDRAPRDGGLSHEGSSFRRRRGVFLPFAASSAFLARAARECPRRPSMRFSRRASSDGRRLRRGLRGATSAVRRLPGARQRRRARRRRSCTSGFLYLGGGTKAGSDFFENALA